MACEGRSREGELVACKFESRFADRGPLRDRRHVDIGQQAHFAVLVQPFVERSSGVDRRCEGHQIVGGTDALGRRDVASVFGVGHLVLIARLDQADVVHVVGFVDLHHHVVAAVVRSHAASGGVVVQFRAVVDVGHERSAVGRQVGDHVAVVGRIDDLAVGGVGQTDEPSGVGLGIGGNDVAVVRAAIDHRRGAEDTGDVAQASAARFAVGVQHVAVVLAFGNDRKGVRCGHDARSAARRDGHVAVVRTACDEVSESRCARGVRDARDAARLRRGEPVGVGGSRHGLHGTVVLQPDELRDGFVACAGSVDEAYEAHGHQFVRSAVAQTLHREVAGALLDRRFDAGSGDDARRGDAVARDLERPRVAVFGSQHEVLDCRAFQHAEQAVCLVVARERRFHFEVAQSVSLPVERPFESGSGGGGDRRRGGERAVADGRPLGNVFQVDVVHQHGGHQLCARAGVDIGRELHQFGGRPDLDAVARGLCEEDRAQHRVLHHVVGHRDQVSRAESCRERDDDLLLLLVERGFDALGCGDADQCVGGVFAVQRVFDRHRGGCIDHRGVDRRREREVQHLLDGQRDDLPVAERQRQIAVGVAGDLPEQTAFAVVGLDRAPCGVVQPFAVDGPESLFIDRHHGGVAAYGNPFAVFVQQRRGLSVGRHRPVVETAFRIGLHAQQRNVEHLVNGGQHDALLLVLVVLVGDDAVAFGILRHRGDDVARGQLAQVGELLVERCDAALEPGDPLLETVDAAAEFRIVVVAATCREGDGGQKQEI